MAFYEMNFDGLVGPTHHYAGLSFGNVASMGNRGRLARPKEAALEGLKKMRAVRDLGLMQGLIPPHPRPHLQTLRACGFEGASPERVLASAFEQRPDLLSSASSASSMWVANAATVSPSCDSSDGRVHLTPANLQAKLHRSIEAPTTSRILRGIFRGERFAHHAPLPMHARFGDEGAANHTRLALSHGAPGVEIFTFGHDPEDVSEDVLKPLRFPARHTRQASELIARSHRLDMSRTVFVQQRPDVIDAGVFHNDVIAVGNGHVLLIHEDAWVEQDTVLEQLDTMLKGNLCVVQVASEDVPVEEAVKSYLFNSQVVTRPDGQMSLICARECEQSEPVRKQIERIVTSAANPINEVHYFDLSQSMRNGGGPACLRLRVVVDDSELAAINHACILTDDVHDRLCEWVERHYREELAAEDLGDPALFHEVQRALVELAGLLDLDEGIYRQS